LHISSSNTPPRRRGTASAAGTCAGLGIRRGRGPPRRVPGTGQRRTGAALTSGLRPSGSQAPSASHTAARPDGRYDGAMLRPESWSRLAGESPVRVGTGAPGSRPRLVAERRRAERGVKSLFGGSKRAGCSVKRTLQPRHIYNGEAEPLMSRRRPCLPGPVPGSARRVPPGCGGRHVRTVWAGTGETRLPVPCRAETGCISRW
jgi:hypothetical protein